MGTSNFFCSVLTSADYIKIKGLKNKLVEKYNVKKIKKEKNKYFNFFLEKRKKKNKRIGKKKAVKDLEKKRKLEIDRVLYERQRKSEMIKEKNPNYKKNFNSRNNVMFDGIKTKKPKIFLTEKQKTFIVSKRFLKSVFFKYIISNKKLYNLFFKKRDYNTFSRITGLNYKMVLFVFEMMKSKKFRIKLSKKVYSLLEKKKIKKDEIAVLKKIVVTRKIKKLIFLFKNKKLKNERKKKIKFIKTLKKMKNYLKFFIFFFSMYRIFLEYYTLHLKKEKAILFKNYDYNLIILLTKLKFFRFYSIVNAFQDLKLRFKRAKGNLFGALRPTLIMLSKLFKKGVIRGYKIICNGRFSRRQRSSKRVFQKGRVSLSVLKAKVEYVFKSVVLRNSLCGFKMYVQYK